MKSALQIVDVTESNLASLACCGIKNPDNPGRIAKLRWMKQNFRHGLRAKVVLTSEGRQCGFIEYIPGEYAWRGVHADGYLFIHCLWIHYRANQRQGWGSTLIAAAVEHARAAGKLGVATIARASPWLSGPAIFLANRFEAVETSPPDYQLLVRKFDVHAPNPSFVTPAECKRRRYGPGITVIASDQCPYTTKFACEIIDCAKHEYGLDSRLITLRSHKDAQTAPTPYAVFSVLKNGRIVADHQISRTRFKNIVRKTFE